MSVKEICTDCKDEIFPNMEEYKLRRNSKLHQWEPICMKCFRKMVLARGRKYGDIRIDGTEVETEIREREEE